MSATADIDISFRRCEYWSAVPESVRSQLWQFDGNTGRHVYVGPVGLGYFRLALHDYTHGASGTWVYVSPNGHETQVRGGEGCWRIPLALAPPPLPRPSPRTCSCGFPHRCLDCGKPNYIEIHGVSDGFCTYCYGK